MGIISDERIRLYLDLFKEDIGSGHYHGAGIRLSTICESTVFRRPEIRQRVCGNIVKTIRDRELSADERRHVLGFAKSAGVPIDFIEEIRMALQPAGAHEDSSINRLCDEAEALYPQNMWGSFLSKLRDAIRTDEFDTREGFERVLSVMRGGYPSGIKRPYWR